MEGSDVTEDEKTAIAKGVLAVVEEVRRQLGESRGTQDRVSSYCPPELRYRQTEVA